MLEQIGSVAAACRSADGADPLDEATWLALRHPAAHQVDVAAETDRFAVVVDGGLSLAVHPDVRRRGYAGRLLDGLLPRHPGPLVAWSHGNHPAAAVLAARHDFTRVRDLWVMRRPMTEPTVRPDADVGLPDGVAIRGYLPDDRDDLLRVNAAAFAAHPEQGAMDEADLAARMAEPWFDPADLLLAHDPDGRLLGFHWTKVHSTELGEVYVLGVGPEGQGRGLGKVLTLSGLRHLAARGVAEVHLYVESDNTRAVALYAGQGFVHADADTHVMYRRAALGTAGLT
ncbi:MAG: mycothiol synthase [Nocardioides sp.]